MGPWVHSVRAMLVAAIQLQWSMMGRVVRLSLMVVIGLGGGPTPAALAAGPGRVVVLPVRGVNVDEATCRRLGAELRRELATRRSLQLVPVEPHQTPCESECQLGLGSRHRASLVVGLDAGSLGATVVLRLTVFDVERGARRGSWQEVLGSLEREPVAAALSRMVGGFLPAPQVLAATPWYRRWWLWSSATALVAAGAVTAIVLATGGSAGDPLWRIVPPARSSR